MQIGFRNFAGAIAIAFTAFTPVVVQASVVYTVVIPSSNFGSPQGLQFLLSGLSTAKQFCSKIQKEYVVDCLAERLEAVAKQVPEGSDYEAFDEVLQDTSQKLESLARANRNRDMARGRATTGGDKPITTTRPLTPVASANAAEVNRQARAILDEAETILLQSGGETSTGQQQYRQLAQAVGSTKVLLRSA